MPIDLLNIDSISSNGTGKLSILTGPGGTLAERVRIDDQGRVGIGTTNPQATLDVAGVFRAREQFPAVVPTTGAGIEIAYSGTVGYMHAQDHDSGGAYRPFNFTSNPILINRNAEGPVVIWTQVPVPGAALTIWGHTASNGDINLSTFGTTPNFLMNSLSFINAEVAATIAMVQAGTDSTIDSGYLRFQTASAGVLAERMRITGSGNVGIGTATPQATLDVNGATFPGIAFGVTDSIGPIMQVSRLNPGWGVIAGLELLNDGWFSAANNLTVYSAARVDIQAPSQMQLRGGDASPYFSRISLDNTNLVIDAGSNFNQLIQMYGSVQYFGGTFFVVTGGISVAGPTGDPSPNPVFQVSTSSRNIGINVQSGTAAYPLDVAGDVRFNGASGNLFWDGANSRLGIGTATPQATLDVITPAASHGIRTFISGSSSIQGIFLSAIGPNRGIVSGGVWQNYHELDIDGAPLLLNRLDMSNGLVGIGVIQPKYKLDVQDQIGITGGSTGASGFVGDFTFSNYLNPQTDQRMAIIQVIAGSGATDADLGQLLFYTANAGVLSERMRIDSQGNVGVGTTNPQASLDVNGYIAINGLPFVGFSATDLYVTNAIPGRIILNNDFQVGPAGSGSVVIGNLPTSAPPAGSQQLWNNGGVLNIA